MSVSASMALLREGLRQIARPRESRLAGRLPARRCEQASNGWGAQSFSKLRAMTTRWICEVPS